MSLATRCTTCGTVFRVVQDQLKVSEGWVRCGRCNEVFNALEGLFDLDRDTPPDWVPTGAPPPPEPATPGSPAAHPASLFDREGEPVDDGGTTVEHRPLSGVPEPHASTVSTAGVPEPAVDPGSPIGIDRGPDPAGETDEPLDPMPAAFPPIEDNEAPAFIRHADRRARWRSPRARAALSAAALLLAGGLSLQAAHHFRDLAAARWPVAKGLLESWCKVAGCTLGTPRRIEDISVESSGLTRAGESTDTFRLSVTLRNRAALALALPSVDLTLTDASGATVSRRALGGADFRAVSATIPASSEVHLQLLLTVAGKRVTGYTVELFYP